MSNQKILSITIPTWNRAHILSEQLSILTEQILKDNLSHKIEIVVSDNGSEDSTCEIVNNFIAKFNFIIYHKNNINYGAKYNLLKALELANGKFCIFLGDDDRYKPNGMRKMINCIENNRFANAIFDSHLFKKNTYSNEPFITLEDLLTHFYYYIGNAGLFIIRTHLIQSKIKKYGYDYFSNSWPQTQLIILSLNSSDKKQILLKSLDLFSESIHTKLMMYNSYYLLRGLYFDLADAIDDIKNEIPITCYQSAKLYLKNQIIQNTFNILQCGVFVDSKMQRQTTISYINLHKYKYSFKEQFFLNLIIFVLTLPNWLSKFLSEIFIFVTRGSKGIAKKNAFVKLENEKILYNKNKDISIRTFNF